MGGMVIDRARSQDQLFDSPWHLVAPVGTTLSLCCRRLFRQVCFLCVSQRLGGALGRARKNPAGVVICGCFVNCWVFLTREASLLMGSPEIRKGFFA